MQTIFSKFSIVAIAATMLSFASCEKETDARQEGIGSKENVTNSPDGSIQIMPSAAFTRTTYEGMETSFEDGDEVGIIAVARKENEGGVILEKGNYANNVRYKYVKTSNSFQPVDKKNTIYRNPVGVLDLYVYYPYNSSMVDATALVHTVFGNQTTKTNFSKADFMLAQCIGYKEGLASLQFNKMMACLELIVNKRVENAVETVTLKSRDNSCVVNTETGEVLTINNSQPFRMYLFSETDNQYRFRAHMPAQEVAKDEYFVDVTLKNGVTKKYNNGNPLSLLKGVLTKYDITLQSRIQVLAGNGGSASVTSPDLTGGVYNDGKSIEASATPIPGWIFKRWEENGMTVGTDNPYTFVSETNRTITAIFERGFFNVGTGLSYTNGTHPRLGGNGCSVTPSRSYVFETKAQLTATPGNGFHFAGWTDGNSNAQRWETAGPMDMVYTATFSRDSYSVTGSASPSSGGSVSGGGSVLFGNSASLNASASSGYHFTGWSNGSGSTTLMIDEVNSNVNYTAYFEADPVAPPTPDPEPDPDPSKPTDPDNPGTGGGGTDPDDPNTPGGGGGEIKPDLTYCIICDITGQGTVSGTGCGKPNGTYTLTATPADGWSSSWTTKQVTVNNGNVNTAVVFTKNEVKKTYTITTEVDTDGGISGCGVTGDGTYEEGTTVTLRARPGITAIFSGWSEGGSYLGSSTTLTFTVTSNRTITASFQKKPGS